MNTVNQNFRLFEDVAISSAAYRAVDRIEGLYAIIAETLATWSMRSRNRQLLAQMDDRLLEDIGLSHSDVQAETAKYFWQQ